MEKTIKVFAPATVSNVGCGFDTLGFALNEPGDIVILKKNNLNKIKVTKITGDKGAISKKMEENTASMAVKHLLSKLNDSIGIDIEIRKKMPLSSGLGSSAASAVAAVFAANKLLNNPFSKNELLEFALLGEKVASKAIHADNVAPCLFGGFILVRDYNPADIVELNYPRNMYCTVLYPQLKINTSEARKLIKKNLQLTKARRHFGNIGALVAGLNNSDYELIGKSIVDEISEPFRSKLIPGYFDIKNAALTAGAIACNISGSGPSIFAFSKNQKEANKIGAEMMLALKKKNIQGKVYISKINPNGPKVIG
ncbi:MAG: homoserine kinase [Ignavibacteriae bacterium]|nr:homoserine kinase [Ignavibacteriota bacterium]NOG99829.1 homoserine kinase [Ignavibacteriota bacterium]